MISNYNIDKSPLLKPSEFWGPKKDRPVIVPTGLWRSSKDTRKAVNWWQPVCDSHLTRDEIRPFRFAKEINDFFEGKKSLSFFDKILNPQNVREFLNDMKVIELQKKHALKGKKTMPKSTKELRELCAIKSAGKITSSEAFLITTTPRFCENLESLGYLAVSNPNNLIPERVADISRVTCNHAVKVLTLSRKLKENGINKPTTILLRGNLAVGKSRAVENILSKDDPTYSPDTFKYDLRKSSRFLNQQIHKEGAANYDKLFQELIILGTNANFIFDQTLRSRDFLSRVLETAATKNSHVAFNEFDAPLLISCLRILGRDVKKEPCAPFAAVAGIFSTFRSERLLVLKDIQENPNITEYRLEVTSDKGQGRAGLAAEKIGPKPTDFKVVDEALYQEATTLDKEEVERIRKLTITQDLLTQYAPFGGIKMDILKDYIGCTIEEALNNRAAEIPIPK